MRLFSGVMVVAAIISALLTLWLSEPIFENENVELVLVGTYDSDTVVTGQNVLLRSENIDTTNDNVEVYMTKFWYDKVQAGYGNVKFEETDNGLNIVADDNEAVVYVAQTNILEYLGTQTYKSNGVHDNELHSPKIAYFLYY